MQVLAQKNKRADTYIFPLTSYIIHPEGLLFQFPVAVATAATVAAARSLGLRVSSLLLWVVVHTLRLLVECALGYAAFTARLCRLPLGFAAFTKRSD